ncbi:MAG: hypothetical protein DHS20C05_19400 [Hyphococcus sp.]|nr:MAG: hypothetical protein DHS20C05_19400 [Marinicaulis sp.]
MMIRFFLTGLLALSAIACEQRTYDTFGVWSPDGDSIYFYTYRFGNADLMRMNADGSEQRRLTRSFENEWWLAVSHDGTRIAYASNKGFKKTAGADLYVMPSSGGRATRLTNDGGMKLNVSWSPDDAYIAYDAGDGAGGADIWLISALGGEPRNLTNTPDVREALPSFRPDGSLVFMEGSDSPRFIAMDVITGEREELSFPFGAVRPYFSSDGSRIAMSVFDDEGQSDVYVMDADGGNLAQLTSHEDQDYAGGWSPDGSRLLFSTYRWGESEIYVMNADGSGKRNLTRTTADKD